MAELTLRSPRGRTLGLVTTASRQGDDLFRQYRDIFGQLGVEDIVDVDLETRRQAGQQQVADRVRACATLFFSGGDQLRITSVLGGTLFHHVLLQEHQRRLTIAGTSAGASMMSDTMIVTGEGDEAPTKNTVRMASGMGLWVGAVIDQHFTQRGRIGRLLSALAQNPGVLGVGLDEDTAIEVDLSEQYLRVWGSRTVTLLDGSGVEETNASESRADRPLAISGVRLHVLPQGYAFDLKARHPIFDHDIRED